MEISSEVVGTLVASFIALMIWLVKKAVSKDETIANTDNIDGDTIKSLSETIKTLSDTVTKNLKDTADFRKIVNVQAKKIASLEEAYAIIVRQNERLSQENAEMEVRMIELERENDRLREMYVDGKIKEVKDEQDAKDEHEQDQDDQITREAPSGN